MDLLPVLPPVYPRSLQQIWQADAMCGIPLVSEALVLGDTSHILPVPLERTFAFPASRPGIAPHQAGLMDQVADYLYNVALVAVTFMGFSTVFVTFREALGGQMSKYDVVLIRNILYFGIITIIGCLLPPLLRLLSAPPALVVRLPSVATAVPLLIFNLMYPRIRREATGKPMPKRVYIDLGLVYAAAALLAANAIGAPFGASLALHAVGITTTLVATFVAFLFGLDLLPTEPARPVEGMNEQTQEQSQPRKGRRRAG